MIQAIAVFCGSKNGTNPIYEDHTRILGQLLAQRNIAVIYGGSSKGLMGAVADAALDQNGLVMGIIPELLKQWEHHHPGISELLIVDTMHTRKKMLYEKCDAAIILPGGFGTLDEVFEILTWNALKIHQKQIFILNSDGFYDHMIRHIARMHEDGFLYDHPDNTMTILTHPEELIAFL